MTDARFLPIIPLLSLMENFRIGEDEFISGDHHVHAEPFDRGRGSMLGRREIGMLDRVSVHDDHQPRTDGFLDIPPPG